MHRTPKWLLFDLYRSSLLLRQHFLRMNVCFKTYSLLVAISTSASCIAQFAGAATRDRRFKFELINRLRIILSHKAQIFMVSDAPLIMAVFARDRKRK